MAGAALDDAELLDALRLNLVPGVGPRIQQTLLERFGTSAAILAASDADLRQVPGVGPKLARTIREHRDPTAAERELLRCREFGIRLIVRDRPDYPRPLVEICDAPPVLYVRGTLETQDELAVAIVGSRHCTIYGRQQAERLARTLAEAGLTVVSGLARGIDAAAHHGALQGNGRTLAVLGTGLANLYPPEHVELAEQVVARGALLTESPLDQAPLPGLFPQRNRIISGLTLGVVIVEASKNSGALHTARHAMEQGREVFAVPGRIDSPASAGCHDLIRDGVTLVRHPDDVLEGLGPLIRPVRRTADEEVHSPRELTLNDQERQVLNQVTTEPKHIDEVVQSAGLEPSRVLSTLTVLEIKKLVRRLPGSYLVRIASY